MDKIIMATLFLLYVGGVMLVFLSFQTEDVPLKTFDLFLAMFGTSFATNYLLNEN